MDLNVENQILEEIKQNDLTQYLNYLGVDLDDLEDYYDNVLEYDDVSV